MGSEEKEISMGCLMEGNSTGTSSSNPPLTLRSGLNESRYMYSSSVPSPKAHSAGTSENCLFDLLFVAVVTILIHNGMPQKTLPLCLTIKVPFFSSQRDNLTLPACVWLQER